MDYRILSPSDMTPALLADYVRRQVVTRCVRRAEDGSWVLRDIAFIDDWTPAERAAALDELRDTVADGGIAFGAFDERGALRGFSLLAGALCGTRGQYADLLQMQVSEETRGQGVGRRLFTLAAEEGRRRGAEALYISAHSAQESQAFYAAMGCIDAREPQKKHVLAEPCDRQLELPL